MPQLMLIVGFSVGWVGGNSCCHWLSKWHIWFWSLHSTVGYYWKPFRQGHLDFSPKCFFIFHILRQFWISTCEAQWHHSPYHVCQSWGQGVGELTSIWRWIWDFQCNWNFLAPWPLSKVSLTNLMYLLNVSNLGIDVIEWC